MPPCSCHPPDEYLLDYAAGALPEAFAIVVAAHACLCPDCRRIVHALEAVGGFLTLGETGPATKDAPLMLPPQENPCVAVPTSPGWAAIPNLPHCLALRMADVPPPSAWPEILPGIRAFPLRDSFPKLNLLSFSRGAGAPRHGHDGLEMTLVLNGQLTDGDLLLSSGSLSVCEPGDTHAPQAGMAMNCLCLWATEKDLVFA